MKQWSWRLVAGSLAIGAAVAAAETDLFAGAANLDREQFLAAVLARNPSLEAARAALRAAEARAPQARALMEPTVSYSVAPLSIGAGVDFGHEIRFEQMLPAPEKRRLRAAAADSEAAQAGEEVARVGQNLLLRASLLFTEWYRTHRALEVNAEHRALMSDFQQVATARYASGLVGQQDPLQAEGEIAELLHQQVRLESEREIVAAEMNALLHRAPAAELPPPPAELREAPVEAAATAALAAEALAHRPEIRALDATVNAREIATALARLERRPDLGLMASYNSMWSDAEHRIMIGAAISLPVRKARIQAAIVEAEALLQAARGERSAVADDIRREVAVAAVRLRESHHMLGILRDRLLPAARDRVQAAFAGFTSGLNDFFALIDAERNLRDAELEFHAALADLHARHAELDRALGRTAVPGSRAADAPALPTEGAIR